MSESRGYLETVERLYDAAAATPMAALCCTSAPPWELPGLVIPQGMKDRNYGCGSTLSPRDLARAKRVLYVGAGAGMEVLQMSYFVRRPGGIVAVDKVPSMVAVARELLAEAALVNDWYDPAFVDLREGDALALPIEDGSVDLVAQNCLFNVFEPSDLDRALREAHRVLREGGSLVLSDPVATRTIPPHLASDDALRAACLSGAPTLEGYVDHLVRAGFGTVEIRSRRPYRLLSKARYGLDEDLLIESIEAVGIKTPIPADGPCVFTGRTAIYVGADEAFDDGKGHFMLRDVPLGVCDKTAGALGALRRDDVYLTPSTWHYAGDGCC